MSTDTCPNLQSLALLLDGDLSASHLQRLEQHLDTCVECCRRLEQLAAGDIVLPTVEDAAHLRPSSAHLQAVIVRVLRSGNDAPLQSLTDSRGESLPSAEVDRANTHSAGRRTPHSVASVDLSFLVPSTEPGLLGCVGPYRIDKVVGWGGMGIVMRAFDPTLQRTVAVKVLNPVLAVACDARARFLREARTAAAIQNEHVVTIHAVDTHQSVPYLVMEYVAGESLQERINANHKCGNTLGPSGSAGCGFDFTELCRISAEIAAGLSAAHADGVIHRDIKPANILLAAGTGCVKITDFGLAKAVDDASVTATGVIAGTPEFMSPEQASGGSMDARSDLFSLGLVLHATCSGSSPFVGETIYHTLRRICDESPPPLRESNPDLPAWFCQLVADLLEKDPQRRVQSADAVIERIRNRSESLPPRRFNPAAVLALLIVPVVVLVALAILARQPPNSAPAETPRASRDSAQELPRLGFRIGGRVQVHESLAAAIEGAANGDVIEVFGNGPYLISPIQLHEKRLTIRAARGAAPLFLHDPPGQPAFDPFLQTDADLQLEGLDFQWNIPAQTRNGTPDESLPRGALLATGGRLRILNCRIVVRSGTSCVRVACAEGEIRNCHLVSRNGPCAVWEAASDSGFVIENSVLEGAAALAIACNADAGRPELILRDNTVVAQTALRVWADTPRRKPIETVCQRNILSVDEVCHLMTLRTPAAGQKQAMKLMLRMRLDWRESDNVYSRQSAFLISSPARRPLQKTRAAPESLVEWLRFWQLTEGASVEGDLRFENRAEESLMAPLRLTAVENASGPVPAESGASAGQVGSGAAFHQWRATPEYALWCRKGSGREE